MMMMDMCACGGVSDGGYVCVVGSICFVFLVLWTLI